VRRVSVQCAGRIALPHVWATLRVLLCLIVWLTSVTARGEEANVRPDSARIVVEQLVSAMQEQDWGTYSSLVHPQHLSSFRQFMLPVIKVLDSTAESREILPIYFDGAKSYAEFAALDSVSFFAGTMSLLTRLAPGLSELFASAGSEIIGSVEEGRDTTHFVCMIHAGEGDHTANILDVVTLIRSGSRWCANLRFDPERLAKAFQK